MKRALLLSALFPFFAMPGGAAGQAAAPAAQEQPAAPAVLLADRVFVTPERQLIAEGNVEALQDGIRLRASRISFDQEGGRLMIEGPIRIDDGSNTTILADAAELDQDLRDGLLTGARLVLNQQMQMAALRMNRVEGRYTQLYKTSVTSCHVCDDGRPPLWQIRAEKVVHDQKEQQIYFENAHLRVLDVPVFYFPGLRMPDPDLKRASGFLIPKVRSTSNLGTGVKAPYFFTMGDSRDLTLTPYLSSKTTTLEARYRQAFRNGRIQLEGAYTRDDLIPGEDRGYLFAEGSFGLNNGYTFEFGTQLISDDAYLADYGLPDLDRLRSQVTITKARRDSLFRAGLYRFKSLRDSEDNNLLPRTVGDVFYQKRYHPERIGGELITSFRAHGHYRSSTVPGDETDSNGRDVMRYTADLEWITRRVLRGGTVAETTLGAAGDLHFLQDESFYPEQAARFTPRAALTLRHPMARKTASGARQILEPILQLGWSEIYGDDVPNEESRFAELDQGNLLELSRFPSEDAREEGVSLVYGVNWYHAAADGLMASATVGQILRTSSADGFTASSGLGGTSSDLLLAGQIKLDGGIGLTARGLTDNSLSISKAEFRGNWSDERTRISGSLLWLEADPEEDRDTNTSEVLLDGGYKINPNWSANANLRYDINESEPTRAGLGFVYSNECVKVDLSVNRRYTSNSSVDPSTDFSFSVALGGFLTGSETQNYRRSCKNT